MLQTISLYRRTYDYNSCENWGAEKFSNIMFDAKFVNFIEINIVAHLWIFFSTQDNQVAFVNHWPDCKS